MQDKPLECAYASSGNSSYYRCLQDWARMTVCCLFLGMSAGEGAIAELGPGFVTLDLTGSGRWDSNPFVNSQQDFEDFIITSSGRVTYQQNKGIIHLNANAGVSFNQYIERDDLSHWDPSLSMSVSGPHKDASSTMDFEFAAGWQTGTSANYEVSNRTRSESVNMNGSVGLQVSDKSGLGLGMTYGDTDYESESYAASTDYSGSLSYNLAISPKLNFQTTGRYRVIEYDIADLESTTGSVGVVGSISPKLTGSAAIGLSKANTTSKAILFYQLDLSWAVDEKRALSITGSRDYSPSAYQTDSIRSSIGLALSQRLTESISFSVNSSMGSNEWQGLFDRTDEYIQAGINLALKIGKHSRAGLGLDWMDRSSDSGFADYDRIQISVSGGTRF
ncbi:MAG: hypothetical protein AB3N63_13025 [Puniceicoccaceae bacterium]